MAEERSDGREAGTLAAGILVFALAPNGGDCLAAAGLSQVVTPELSLVKS